MTLEQRGYNNAFPLTIETWKWGDQLPDWLSDRCNISKILEDGTLVPTTNENSRGGYTIQMAGSTAALVSTTSKDDFVCFGVKEDKTVVVFSLTPTKLNLLYEKIIVKKK